MLYRHKHWLPGTFALRHLRELSVTAGSTWVRLPPEFAHLTGLERLSIEMRIEGGCVPCSKPCSPESLHAKFASTISAWTLAASLQGNAGEEKGAWQLPCQHTGGCTHSPWIFISCSDQHSILVLPVTALLSQHDFAWASFASHFIGAGMPSKRAISGVLHRQH